MTGSSFSVTWKSGKLRSLVRHAAFVLAVVIGLSPADGLAEQPNCKRPELAWEFWLGFTEAMNPGITHAELEGLEKDRILAEFSCVEGGPDCPPDHAYTFHCQGNSDVLVVFVNQGCVTLVEEREVGYYLKIIAGEFEC